MECTIIIHQLTINSEVQSIKFSRKLNLNSLLNQNVVDKKKKNAALNQKVSNNIK